MEPIAELIIHKPTAAIQIGSQFTLVQQKLLNVLIFHSQTGSGQHQTISSEEKTISLARVYKAINWKAGKNIADLQNALETLVTTKVEWNEFKKDRSHKWAICTFLASGEIENGKLRYIVNPKIVQQINRPTLFAKFRLVVQGMFGKRYSLVLYESLVDALSRANKQHILLKVELGDLIRLLNLEDSAYSAASGFKHFNHRVLKPCIKEINTHSDISVEVTPRREARKVVSIDFEVKRKEDFQLVLDLEREEGIAPKSLSDESKEKLIEQLIHCGVTKTVARELTGQFGVERISGNIQYVEEKVAEGKTIPNRGGYLVAAIKSDYRQQGSPVEAEEQARRVDAENEKRVHEKASFDRKKLEEEFQKFRSEQVRARFSKRSRQFQTRRKNNFTRRVESGDIPTFGNSWKEKGLDSPAMSATFFGELMPELLTEMYENDFDAFCQWKAGRG